MCIAREVVFARFIFKIFYLYCMKHPWLSGFMETLLYIPVAFRVLSNVDRIFSLEVTNLEKFSNYEKTRIYGSISEHGWQ